tara:strand:+ start:882 stop:1082 length:201 start_codon:yes stop_codon:yes gene_type:complete
MTQKYKRLLSANHYNGCSDRIARQIDVMAGLLPESIDGDYKLEWRGKDRKINSRLDADYDKRKGDK